MKERFYDRLNSALDRKGFGERRDRLVGRLTGDVLEIGAGTGLNLLRYRSAARLVAIEPDPHYRRRLQARANQAHVPPDVIDASAEALPFADQSFDHVVTSICLCSVADLKATLAEIHRVLRPGGSLAFLEHIRGTGRLGRWQDRLTPLQRRLADGCRLNRDTQTAIQAAGFHFESVEGFTMPRGHPLIKDATQGTAIKHSQLDHETTETAAQQTVAPRADEPR
jgi:ubiquinone/menaquinone biosynthesis C-methylase UbiE